MNVYEGTQNYIFVSYAHKDTDRVLPIIEALQKANFRVWFDSGIEAGTEWPAYIEEHLTECARVLVVISPAFVASPNCRKELTLASNLDKQILAIYLEQTELAQGMNLQLNSSQSLFRERHRNFKSFSQELTAAKILQCCKIGSAEDIHMDLPDFSDEDFMSDFDDPTSNEPDKTSYKWIKNSRMNAPAMIRYVATKGSESSDDLWPKGPSTHTINMDKCCEVRFIMTLLRPIGKEGDFSIGLMIYDAAGNLVWEDISTIECKPNYDRISKRWTLRDTDGPCVAPGRYKALLWFEDSRTYECQFTLVSNEQSIAPPPIEPSGFRDTKSNAPSEKMINLYKRWQELPRALFAALLRFAFGALVFVSYYLSMFGSAFSDGALSVILTIGGFLLAIIFALLWAAAGIVAIIFSGKYVFPSWWLAVPCPILFPRMYLIGLIALSIIRKINKDKWEQQIAAYEYKNGA